MKKNLEWLKSEVRDMNRNKGLTWKDEVMDLISQVEKSITPTLPEHVVEFKENAIREGFGLVDILRVVEKSYHTNYPYMGKSVLWVFKNTETFIRAWLDGYNVEDKYLVLNNRNETMLVKMLDGGAITESDAFSVDEMYPSELESHLLTEREVREYDERYLPFMIAEEDIC